MDLYVQERNAISVDILSSSSSDTYSYLYFENLNTSNGQCLRYLLTSLNSTPCNKLILCKPCRLHVRNTHITLNLKGVDGAIPRCIKSADSEMQWPLLSDNSMFPECEMSAYDFQSIHPASRWIAIEDKCPRNCECNLSYRKLSSLCKTRQSQQMFC